MILLFLSQLLNNAKPCCCAQVVELTGCRGFLNHSPTKAQGHDHVSGKGSDTISTLVYTKTRSLGAQWLAWLGGWVGG